MTVNVVTGIGLVGVGLYYGLPNEAIAAIAIGATVGTLVTPDYDFEKNLPKSIIGRIPLLGYMWNTFWMPYAKVVKHRSVISHSPILSTGIRFLYFYIGVTCLLYLFDLIAGTRSWEYGANLFYISGDVEFWLLLFAVWCVEDITHLILDMRIFRIFKRGDR